MALYLLKFITMSMYVYLLIEHQLKGFENNKSRFTL